MRTVTGRWGPNKPIKTSAAGQGQGSTSTRRALTRVALASVAVAVGIAGAMVSRRAAETAATDDARTVTEVLAHSVIVPNLTDAWSTGTRPPSGGWTRRWSAR